MFLDVFLDFLDILDFCEFPVEHVGLRVTTGVGVLGSDRKCHRFNQPEKVGSGSSQNRVCIT